MSDEKRKLGRGIASLLENNIDTSILNELNEIKNQNNENEKENVDINNKVVELPLEDIEANIKINVVKE